MEKCPLVSDVVSLPSGASLQAALSQGQLYSPSGASRLSESLHDKWNWGHQTSLDLSVLSSLFTQQNGHTGPAGTSKEPSNTEGALLAYRTWLLRLIRIPNHDQNHSLKPPLLESIFIHSFIHLTSIKFIYCLPATVLHTGAVSVNNKNMIPLSQRQ